MIGFNFFSFPFVFEYARNIAKNKHLNLVIGFFWLLELKEENGLKLTFNYKIMQCAWIKLLIMHGMHEKDILKKIYLFKWFVLQSLITFDILSFMWYVIFKLHLPN
jgi:hypothetical protein